MMTFKDLKKLVELPSYKEQRVPTVKALEVSGVPVVAEKILENHGSISVYQNGYVIYRAHKRVTVFSLRNCVHYKYVQFCGEHNQQTFRVMEASVVARMQRVPCKQALEEIFQDRFVKLQNGFLKYRDA